MTGTADEGEALDPTPDIHSLFQLFNRQYFDNRLGACSVEWSSRMKLCAGLCYWNPLGGCTIRLSQPLLQFRPRQDLINTLLHEMIHALLFLCPDARRAGNSAPGEKYDDHSSHGPNFLWHMNRINRQAGSQITVYHTFHDEVEYYRRFIYRCDGPCRQRPPYLGFVKRSIRRQPGPSDRWWSEHQQQCGGTFHRIDNEDEAGVDGTARRRKVVSKEKPSEAVKRTKTLDNYFTRLPGAGRTLGSSGSHNSDQAIIGYANIPVIEIDETMNGFGDNNNNNDNNNNDNNNNNNNNNGDLMEHSGLLIASSSSSSSSSVETFKSSQTPMIECPCCPAMITVADINSHLDSKHFGG